MQVSHPSTPVTITTEEVRASFRQVRVRRAAGPDDISGRHIHECGDSLTSVYCELFQRPLDEGDSLTSVYCELFQRSLEEAMFQTWKSSGRARSSSRSATVMNDYRPVALTSIPFNCAERIVMHRLRLETADHQYLIQILYYPEENSDVMNM